ncbi:MAG: sigma-54 dependent transcriptional regulator [Gemmataceae bacterium]|nr:sigma-54 dependent transcriptional regulator [Gemmataceae bacterium]MCI0743398.1 sigma-54 dependent transcriptional regulator [Gemmataceae bacterium]
MTPRTALVLSADSVIQDTVMESVEPIEDLHVISCRCLPEVHDRLHAEDVALVLLHLAEDADESANDLARFVSAKSATHHCVVMSDQYHDQQAVRFLRLGAADYFGLPMDRGRLNYLLDALTVRARSGKPRPVEHAGLMSGQDLSNLVLDPDMGEMREQVRRVVGQETTILFTGETGTGKTRLARMIHELSPRRDQPFLVVDCGALSASLIESEMFGHVKGAFTGADRERQGKFAAAGTGTLLLDEVNSLPPALQSKLLRAVDDRVFEPVGSNKVLPLKARLIVASNKSLDQEVQEGRFRADLYYRLNVVGFFLTPLRERRAAIPLLANRFLAEFVGRNCSEVVRIHPDAMRMLKDYSWPGNIRELRNVVERAVSLCPGKEILVADLPEAVRTLKIVSAPLRPSVRVGASVNGTRPTSLHQSREEVEILRITEALEKHGNNRLRAAAELGISRMALYKKLHKYGLMGTG